MKRKKILSLALVGIALVAIGTAVVVYTQNKPIDESEIKDIADGVADYLHTKPEDLYESAEYVVVGELGEDIKTYGLPEGAGYPLTVTTITPLEVLKGDPPDSIEFTYRGGILPYREYLEAQPDYDKERMMNEYETSPKLREYKYVRAKPDTEMKKGNRYLFFLSYNETLGTYQAHAGPYGALLLTDDGTEVFRPGIEKYESVDDVVSRMLEE